MTEIVAPTGGEAHIRAIVYREGESYVAQCLEYDIAAQGPDIKVLLNRLHLTVEAEFAACKANGQHAHTCIAPAPNYYHDLWERRSVELKRVHVPTPASSRKEQVAQNFEIEAALAA